MLNHLLRFVIGTLLLLIAAVFLPQPAAAQCCDSQIIDCPQGYQFDLERCRCVFTGGSPILVDVTGHRFQLTDAAHGVFFDINGDGIKEQIAWTQASSSNAFLTLDRNHNGTIDDGTELFGNFTPQPPSPEKNGFLALAEYDKPEYGGNGDGLIDDKDVIFRQLRLWIDSNHNGISESGELFPLSALGITAISLDYRESRRTDQYGNVYHYRAKVAIGENKHTDRWAYDVSLVTDPGQAASTGRTGKLLTDQPFTQALRVTQDRGIVLQVRNTYTQPITAFIMTVNPAGGDSSSGGEVRSYFDVYINYKQDEEIVPGALHETPVAHILGSDPASLKPRIRAMIFADGTRWGEGNWISKILTMRARLSAGISRVSQLLNPTTPTTNRAELIGSLQRERALRKDVDKSHELEDWLIDNLILTHAIANIQYLRINGVTATPEKAVLHLTKKLQQWRKQLNLSRPSILSTTETARLLPSSTVTTHLLPRPFQERRVQSHAASLYQIFTLRYAALLMFQGGSCSADDESVVVYGPDNCGTQTWDLRARASDGVLLDVGYFNAFGACTGNYTNCAGSWEPPSNTGPAWQILSLDSIDSGTGFAYHWLLENAQQATYTACDCTDPYPDGVTETVTLETRLTAVWLYYCG